MEKSTQSFWSNSPTELLNILQVTASGMTSTEAEKRFLMYGSNRLKAKSRSNTFSLLVDQFKSPIVLILLAATGLSLYLHNIADASIILASS